jgi:DNA-directed RNA polymerase subunit beta'
MSRKDEKKRRASRSRDDDGKDVEDASGGEDASTSCRSGAQHLMVQRRSDRGRRRRLAKIPRETSKTKDITGGLPRVAELFEARKPKEPAVISEIDGTCQFGKDTKGKRKVVVRDPENGEPKEYLIPKGKHVNGARGRQACARAIR